MRVALSMTPIDSSVGKPNRLIASACGSLRVVASRRGADMRGVSMTIAMAATNPAAPRMPNAGRHGITTSINAASAGIVIFPISPAKL